MSKLSVTLIDVGWGDSVFVESTDNGGNKNFGLIDSNDSKDIKSSYIFLKRFFERENIDLDEQKPIFDFVMLSHAHSDHGNGLKYIMSNFGTKNFYYPKSTAFKGLSSLIKYANRAQVNINFHQSIDNSKIFENFGDVNIRVLWPRRIDGDIYDRDNENNNSIILLLTLRDISFVLSGDAEDDVWSKISNNLPESTRFFKVPHHGSVNGTFRPNTNYSSYLERFDVFAKKPLLGISSHIRPFAHPDKEVVEAFERKNYGYYQTDKHYHITFSTDGNTNKEIEVKYSRV